MNRLLCVAALFYTVAHKHTSAARAAPACQVILSSSQSNRREEERRSLCAATRNMCVRDLRGAAEVGHELLCGVYNNHHGGLQVSAELQVTEESFCAHM